LLTRHAPAPVMLLVPGGDGECLSARTCQSAARRTSRTRRRIVVLSFTSPANAFSAMVAEECPSGQLAGLDRAERWTRPEDIGEAQIAVTAIVGNLAGEVGIRRGIARGSHDLLGGAALAFSDLLGPGAIRPQAAQLGFPWHAARPAGDDPCGIRQ